MPLLVHEPPGPDQRRRTSDHLARRWLSEVWCYNHREIHKVVPYGGPKNKNQFRIRPRFRRNQALWAKNTDADGFGICSPLVFDRSAEQIGRKPICPNLIGTGSSLIYQISYLFLNRNQSRIGPRRRQNHKAWPEIWTRTGTDPGLVPVFVKTIRNGLRFKTGPP